MLVKMEVSNRVGSWLTSAICRTGGKQEYVRVCGVQAGQAGAA